MNSFSPRFEILPVAQKALWPALAPCKDLEFVLYGGTAIALQLGHRSSVDFDFFSHRPLDGSMEEKMIRKLPFLSESLLLQKEPDTRTWSTREGVKLSFFGSIRFGRTGHPLTTEDGVLHVASLDDLMAMKLGTLLQRVEAKDYRDIAAMLRHGIHLGKGLAGAAALYGKQFPITESLKAMTWFQGGDLDRLSKTDRDTLLDAAKRLQVHCLPEVHRLSNSLMPVEVKIGARVSFHVSGNKSVLTGTVVAMDGNKGTVTIQCGKKTVPLFREKGWFSEAAPPKPEETKDYALEEARKAVGEKGQVFFAANEGIYRGPIIGTTPCYALQKTGENTVILHRLKDLGKDTTLPEGEVIIRKTAERATIHAVETDTKEKQEKNSVVRGER